ncbi:MAG TPA: O-antigen ligase family protein [Caulobacteraceae bacterium]|nr:O-antigen ligase family protein [Caulobacteraceae bacterium]
MTALGLVLATGIFTCRTQTSSSIKILAMVVAYVFILLANLLFLDGSVFDLVRDRLSWAMVAIGGTVLLSNLRNPRQFLLILRVVIIASALIVLAEFFSGFSLPAMMTTVPGRAAGLFENPNITGVFFTFALPVVTIGLRPVHRAFWYGLTLTCVFLTFSRGGLALCALAILLVEVFPVQGGGSALMRRLVIGAVLVATAVPAYVLISTFIVSNFGSELDANTIARARLEGDSSSDVRMYVLKLAWQEFSTSPIWGHGTGAADRWEADVSVHNQFGLIAMEYGVIGLAWFAAFLGTLWSMPRPFGIWATSMFVVAGMTLHNLFDGATYALLLATYAALPAIFSAQLSQRPLSPSAARGPFSGRRRFRPPAIEPRGNLIRSVQGSLPQRPPGQGEGG